MTDMVAPYKKVYDYVLHFPAILSESDIDKVISGIVNPSLNNTALDEDSVTMFHGLCESIILKQYKEQEMADVPWGMPDQLYFVEVAPMKWERKHQILHNNPNAAKYLVTAAMILDDGPVNILFGGFDKTVQLTKGEVLIFPANFSFRFTPTFNTNKTCRVCYGSLAPLVYTEGG